MNKDEVSSVLDDLPERLSIGFAEWQVEVVEKGSLKLSGGVELLGLCETEFFTIKIADEQTDTNAKNTFIHEMLHAIYNSQGLPDLAEEETVVTALANGLMAAFQDNPDLQVWFVNHLCGDIEHA